MVYGQDGIAQNGTEKWYGQNGTILYFVYTVHFNSVEFNIDLVTKSHK